MIRHTSFKHGWIYHYRLHDLKKESLCNKYPSLITYLNSMFTSCPDEHFQSGPRGSNLKFKINADLKRITGHEISELAKEGLNKIQERTAHTKIQTLMLEKDNKTISAEVPIWLKHAELNNYEQIFNSKEPLTGHIDLLRIEDSSIWVWDYKPNAELERYAGTQTFFYALMLSKRTGIPLGNFRCGYFDERVAYAFKPHEDSINTLLSFH